MQHLRLFSGLNALGDGANPKLLRHRDHRLQNLPRLLRVLRLIQEHHIDLQNIHRDVLQHIQRRVAAAEIIHFHQEPVFLQLLNQKKAAVHIIHHNGLGDFKAQILRRNVISLHQRSELLIDIHEVEILRRNVDRKIQLVPSFLFPSRKNPAGLLPDTAVCLRNLSVPFQNRKKASGR